MTEQTYLKVTLCKSRFKRIPKHRATIEALGLRKIGQTVLLENSKCLQGMIAQVGYLLKVEEE